MAKKLYPSGNAIVYEQDNYLQTFPIGTVRYHYNKTRLDYSFYHTREREIIIDGLDGLTYDEILKEDGTQWNSDEDFQGFWNDVLGSKNILDSEVYIDAGGRLRVSQLNTLIDVKQSNDNEPLYYDRENVSGGTQVYDIADGGVTMAVTSNGDAAISQTKMYAPYFAGKSQFIEITFSGFGNEADVTKRAGYFNSSTTTPFDADKDGIWFESDGTNHRFKIEKFGTEIFNEVYTGEIDFDKFNVLIIQFLYLGGTAVRFGFIVDGAIEWVTTYKHAGFFPNTFVRSPNQPIRYEIRSTGGLGSFVQICAQVASEGSTGEVGVSRAVWNQDFQASSSGTIYATLGIRLKDAYRNIRVDKEDINMLSEANDDFQWWLVLNPTIQGTAPTWVDLADSAIQYARAAPANTIIDENDLGLVLDTGFVSGNSQIQKPFKNSIRIGSQIDGTVDEMWLIVQPIQAGLDVWTELSINEFI